MAVYATNLSKNTQGIVKPINGADHLIPPLATDFVISSVDLEDVVYHSAFVRLSEEPTFFEDRDVDAPKPYYLFRFKGYLQYSTDFPEPNKVSKGDTFVVTNIAGVTDNSVTRTNTGASFDKGDQIYWAGAGWSIDHAASGAGGADADWQTPVLSRVAEPAGGESVGARYLVTSPATGDFVGKEEHIAILGSSGWEFQPPTTNMSVIVSDTDSAWTYDADSGAWVEIAGPEILFTVGAGLTSPIPNKLMTDLDPAGGLGYNAAGDGGQIRIEVVDGGTF